MTTAPTTTMDNRQIVIKKFTWVFFLGKLKSYGQQCFCFGGLFFKAIDIVV